MNLVVLDFHHLFTEWKWFDEISHTVFLLHLYYYFKSAAWLVNWLKATSQFVDCFECVIVVFLADSKCVSMWYSLIDKLNRTEHYRWKWANNEREYICTLCFFLLISFQFTQYLLRETFVRYEHSNRHMSALILILLSDWEKKRKFIPLCFVNFNEHDE